MSAMILLGIFISGLIFNLKDNADSLNGSIVSAIESFQAKVGEPGGPGEPGDAD